MSRMASTNDGQYENKPVPPVTEETPKRPKADNPAPVAPTKTGRRCMVYLPLSESNPKDDVQEVVHNGKVYLIRRGVSVEVPGFIADNLVHAKKIPASMVVEL